MKDIKEVQERGFGDVLNCINSGIYITDTERRIVFWSKLAEEITGYSAEEVLGSRCMDNILQHRDKDGRLLCTTDLCPLHRSMILSKRSESPIVVYCTSKSGEELAVSVSTAPVYDDEGRVIGGVEVFREERENIRQMELARTVHRQMLTQTLPEDERLSFAVEYAPVAMVGGDFYHLRQLSPDEYVVFLADAAGHGVSAALSSALIYSLLFECQDSLSEPAVLMVNLNYRAYRRAPGLGFFTAVCAKLNAARRTLTFCTAGHPPPFLQRAGEAEPEVLMMPQLPLGVQPGAAYEGRTLNLESGDRLLMYSDGATDIQIGEEQRLGMEGLRALLAEHPPSGEHGLTEIYEAMLARCVTVQPEDDITLVSCLVR